MRILSDFLGNNPRDPRSSLAQNKNCARFLRRGWVSLSLGELVRGGRVAHVSGDFQTNLGAALRVKRSVEIEIGGSALQGFFGSGLGFLGALHVNFFGALGGVGENRDLLRQHFGESPCDREVVCVRTSTIADLADGQSGDQRRVTWQNAEFAVLARNLYHLDALTNQQLIGGYDFEFQRVSHRGLRLCRFHLLGFFQHFVDGALHVERLFWNIVALAIHDLLEAAHRVLDLHVASLNASKLLSNVEGLRQELLDLAGARHRELLVFAEFVDTENRDDVLQVLVALQHALNGLRRVVVLLAHDARIENARSGSQRIDCGINAQLRNLAREHRGCVEVSEGRRRRRIGQVIGGHIDGLHRRDRAFLGRGDAFLQLAHFGGEVGLISHGRRHPPQQRRDFRTRLREAEYVVDKEQRVGAFFVTEVLGNRERGQRHAQARSRRLGHLAVDQRGLRLRGVLDVDHTRFLHLEPEVVALARALADSGKHREATVLERHVVDKLHDDDGLADASAAEQPDLAALQERLDQVNDLHAGLEHFHRGGLLVECRRQAMDGHTLGSVHWAKFVHRLPNDVEHTAQGLAAHGHGDGTALIDGLHAAHHAFSRLHGDTAHAPFAELLLHFEDDIDGLGNFEAFAGDAQRRVDRRQRALGKLHVHRGTCNLNDVSDVLWHISPLSAIRAWPWPLSLQLLARGNSGTIRNYPLSTVHYPLSYN